MNCGQFNVNPVPTDILYVMTHTVVLFIQRGQTASDMAKDYKQHKVVQYLNEFGEYYTVYHRTLCM